MRLKTEGCQLQMKLSIATNSSRDLAINSKLQSLTQQMEKDMQGMDSKIYWVISHKT